MGPVGTISPIPKKARTPAMEGPTPAMESPHGFLGYEHLHLLHPACFISIPHDVWSGIFFVASSKVLKTKTKGNGRTEGHEQIETNRIPMVISSNNLLSV